MAWNVSSADRFGFDMSSFGQGSEAAESQDTRPVGPAGSGGAGVEASPEIAASMVRGAGGWAWTAPTGWRQQADRSTRVVTFHMGPDGDEVGECYVTQLSGPAGGVEANLNRWCQQMGAEALTPRALDALDTVRVLGFDAKLLEVDGHYTGMGGESVEEARLLGAVVPLPASTLFIKLTGPRELVAAERGAFVAFCESIREGGS